MKLRYIVNEFADLNLFKRIETIHIDIAIHWKSTHNIRAKLSCTLAQKFSEFTDAEAKKCYNVTARYKIF